jgi:hypothetical protein
MVHDLLMVAVLVVGFLLAGLLLIALQNYLKTKSGG